MNSPLENAQARKLNQAKGIIARLTSERESLARVLTWLVTTMRAEGEIPQVPGGHIAVPLEDLKMIDKQWTIALNPVNAQEEGEDGEPEGEVEKMVAVIVEPREGKNGTLVVPKAPGFVRP